jgi:hypothetical protein
MRTSLALLILLAPLSTRAAEVLATSTGLVELEFPRGWSRNPEKNPFELQAFSRDQQMMTAVFEFQKKELAASTRPAEILRLQIDDMRGKRKNFTPMEKERTERSTGRSLTSAVFSGEKGEAKHVYRFTLVEFPADPEVFLVVLQSCVPSEWKRSKPVFEAITRSARLRGRR